jgi:membrane-associated protease RseP (regulator of RpoE activity)
MFLFFLLCICACILHLLTILLTGIACGVRVKKVSFGYGPKLLVTPLFELGALPWGGSIAFKDSRVDTSLDDVIFDSLDQQSLWKQLLISSSGCLILFLVAIGIGGAKGVEEFVGGFHLFLVKVFDFSAFSSLPSFINSASLSNQLIVITAKLAALNLIPYFGSNGLVLIHILIKSFLKDFEFAQGALRKIALFSMTFFGLWFANLAHFLAFNFL